MELLKFGSMVDMDMKWCKTCNKVSKFKMLASKSGLQECIDQNFFVITTQGIVFIFMWYYRYCSKGLQCKKEGKDQESSQSGTAPYLGWESNNFTIRHHKREPRGQLFPSRWPQSIDKQTRESITKKRKRNNINDTQKKHRLGTFS